MNWWTEKLPPTQTIKYMLVLGALSGVALVLLIPRFTTVGEVLGVIAVMTLLGVRSLIFGLENFREARLNMLLGFAFECCVFGALGYVYNM
jgi:hypothetical protein